MHVTVVSKLVMGCGEQICISACIVHIIIIYIAIVNSLIWNAITEE